ncbi:hypothetical protein Vretimale_8849, partial [Volvox reticuliferus]
NLPVSLTAQAALEVGAVLGSELASSGCICRNVRHIHAYVLKQQLLQGITVAAESSCRKLGTVNRTRWGGETRIKYCTSGPYGRKPPLLAYACVCMPLCYAMHDEPTACTYRTYHIIQR